MLAKVYNRRAIEVEEIVEELLSYADRLRPMVADTRCCSTRALDEGRTVLFEGAQATMLDVDHGTYPFVTSSNPIAGGACTGAGVGPTRIDRVIGVIKAYTTRVGSGPFPTELFDDDGEKLWRIGGEVGVSTGRDRRCGWYDAVIARYASPGQRPDRAVPDQARRARRWDRVPVCVAYDVDGVAARRDADDPERSSTTRSRSTSTSTAGRGHLRLPQLRRSAEERPAYVEALEEMSGAQFWGVGVGPGREQTIVLR